MIAGSVFAAKVVGTMSVGLWAGYNLSLVHRPNEPLLAGRQWRQLFRKDGWRSADAEKLSHDVRAALAAAKHHRRRPAAVAPPGSSFTAARLVGYSLRALHVSALSGLAFAVNFVAYAAAGASGKHPYLLYLALGAPLVGALQYYGARKLVAQGRLGETAPAPAPEPEQEEPEESGLGASSYEHVKAPHAPEPSAPEPSAGEGSVEVFPLNEFTLEHKYGIFSTVVAGLSTFLFLISVVGLAGDTTF